METGLKSVALLGDINVDVFMHIRSFPALGGDGLADATYLRAGGSSANTALVLARLGVATQLFASVGPDGWAGQVLDVLRGAGVGLEPVVESAGQGTGLCMIAVTPDGERTMFTYRGANSVFSPENVNEHALAGRDWLHLSGYAFLTPPQSEAAWKAARLAKLAGIPVSLDIGVEPAYQLAGQAAELSTLVDVLVMGEQEACALAGCRDVQHAASALLAWGIGLVVLKRGEAGCRMVTPAVDLNVAGFTVPVVDTTGAGDAFCAGLIFARLHGLEVRLCGRLANACGALAAMQWGGGEALPGREDVKAFLQSQAFKSADRAALLALLE